MNIEEDFDTLLSLSPIDLQTSETRYRRLFESARDGILILDAVSGKITDVNPYMTEFLGYTREEFVGKELWEIGLLKDEDASIAAFQQLQLKHFIRYENLPLKTRQGERREVEFVSDVHSESGRRVIQCNIRDITERKILAENVSSLAAIVESSNDAIISKNFDGTVLSWNKAAENIFGYTAKEIIGQNISVLFPLELLNEGNEIVSKIRRGEYVRDFETVRLKKDGSEIPVFLSHSPIKNISGEIVGISKIAHDITRRIRAEKALEEAAQRERAMIENALDVICTIDAEGKFASVSPACFKVWGYHPEEIIGHSCVEFVVTEDVAKTGAAMLEIMSGIEVTNFENCYRHKNGSTVHVNWTALWSETDHLIFCIAHNITATKELEQQLRQAQKLESVGLLAGGIAHDFNNMLTAINGYSDLTLRQLKADDPLRINIEEIRKAGQRSADLTNQLLAFSRQQVLHPVVLDINELIADTIKMLERLIGEDIQLIPLLNPQLGRVIVDLGQFSQIVMNLVVNARDAMPEGGNLTIETDNVFLDTAYTRRHIDVLSGSYVLLAVSDNGSGMSEENRQHIFEPFFTTKEAGQGTGLGLATVYGIVKQSGGDVEVFSEQGVGTTFKIYLPQVTEPSDLVRIVDTSFEMPAGTETILLVEDEEIVRKLSKLILETCGYTVIEAKNGLEALEICETKLYKFDLLVTDVVMPQMGGLKLAKKLIETLPDLQILFTSGYTDDAVVRHGVIRANTNFIQKPFTPEALAGKIRQILNGSPTPVN